MTLVTTNATLNMDSILSIAVARREGELNQRKADLLSEHKAAEKTLADLRKRLPKAALEDFESQNRQIVNAFQSLAEALNPHVSKEYKVKTEYHEDKVVIGLEKSGTYSHISEIFPYVASDEVTQIRAEIIAAESELERLNGELRECLTDIQSLPSYERQMRARIAQVELEKTDEGRELLKILSENPEEGLAKLTQQ